jgi:hypothetical protein
MNIYVSLSLMGPATAQPIPACEGLCRKAALRASRYRARRACYVPSALSPPQHRWRRTVPQGRTVTVCRRGRAVSARNEHAVCRPRSAIALAAAPSGSALCSRCATRQRKTSTQRAVQASALHLPFPASLAVQWRKVAPQGCIMCAVAVARDENASCLLRSVVTPPAPPAALARVRASRPHCVWCLLSLGVAN